MSDTDSASANAVGGRPISLFGGKDPRELDEPINEIVHICGEAQLFDRDLQRAAEGATESMKSENSELWQALEDPDKLVHVSALKEVVQEILSHYVSLEKYFMVSNLHRAVCLDMDAEETALDTPNTEETEALQSTMVDEVFYVLRYSCGRAFSTHARESACATINHVIEALSGPYRRMLQDRLRHTQDQRYQTVGAFFSDASHSSLAQRREAEALNNVEMTSQYLSMLKDTLHEQSVDTFDDPKSLEMTKHCLAGLTPLGKGVKEILKNGIARLVRPLQSELIPSLDKLEHVNFEISEHEFGDNEVRDPFAEQLTRALESQLDQQKRFLNPNTFDLVVMSIASYVASSFEKHILRKQFTFNGGLQVDKDIRRILLFFSNLCKKSVRDKFSRLSQIASILQLYEVSEMSEYWGDGSEHWRLSAVEVKKVMRLRVEFRAEAIDRLEL